MEQTTNHHTADADLASDPLELPDRFLDGHERRHHLRLSDEEWLEPRVRAIQRYLPAPRHVEVHRVFVETAPKRTWEAARHFDASEVPWIHFLFALRTLPDRIVGRSTPDEDLRIGIDQIASSTQPGFMVLEEVPGEHVVIGAVGQFWHLSIPFADVRPNQFRDFDEPGWGKVAWSISVEPYHTGSSITLELRTTATDDESWKKLENYYRLIGPASRLIRRSVMSHIETELGWLRPIDDDEKELPGDERLPNARYALTHGIDIEAPPPLIWRYLMQLGCDRGGWYSIDRLDHGGEPSVEEKVEGWDSRVAGELLAATPQLDSFFTVYTVDVDRAFVIGGETERLGGPYAMSWAFVLEPIGADATRLITRVRMEAAPRLSEWLQGGVLGPPIHALMEHAQLKHLKRLAEKDAQQREV